MNPTEPAISAKPVFGPATAVLALAVSGRWRAPETTAALAHQAAMQARSESDISTALLAEGWLLHGLLAVGRGTTGVERAVSALEDAARSGNASAEARLRVGLASAARELGDMDSASALLSPVLERDIIDPELAVDAFLEAIRCDGRPVAGGAHAAVELAVGHIRTLRGEQVELGLAALDAALAAQHRAAGRIGAAVARAREGLRRLLGESAAGSELDPISPHLAATLSFELTRALLDDGQPELACRVAEPALAWAGRPAALVPLTRLRLVLAEHAYLPAGQYDAALRAVGWAADVVGDHDLPELEADCQSLLADVHERRGALPEALAASRRAHAALRTHSARVEQALVLLGRCAVGSGVRPVADAAAWNQGGYGAGRLGTVQPGGAPAQSTGGVLGPRMGGATGGRPGAAAGPDHSGRPDSNRLTAEADNATVRLRSVSRPSEAEPVTWAGTSAPGNAPVPGSGNAWNPDGRDGGRQPDGDAGDDGRNARPAAAMASSSLDDWAAVTGWPGEPISSADPADTFGSRAVRTEFQRPEGIGAISAGRPETSPARDLSSWGDPASITGAFAPAERARPEPGFDAPGMAGDAGPGGWSPDAPANGRAFADGHALSNGLAFANGHTTTDGGSPVGVPHLGDGGSPVGLPHLGDGGLPLGGLPLGGVSLHGPGARDGADRAEREVSIDGDRTPAGDGTDADEEVDGTGDELGELFEPDEQRPLGLVAIDVVTPRGPLTGYVAKPLLAHIADQARTQLPANARLQVLSSDMVLVVLPPVDADVVLRWMRSLATRLSARWEEYASEVPRSAYRVAVGAFDAELSAPENVARLRARLAGVARQSGAEPALPGGGGRHVARGASAPYDVASRASRTSAEPGTGGRRRRREGGGEAVERPSTPPPRGSARTDSVSNGAPGGSPASGHTTMSATRDSTPAPNGHEAQGALRPYSKGRGIDRVALARLAQMAWRPTIGARPVDGPEDAAQDSAEEISGSTHGAPTAAAAAAPAEQGSVRNNRSAETLLLGDTPSARRLVGNGAVPGPVANGSAGDETTADVRLEHVAADKRARHNGVGATAPTVHGRTATPPADGEARRGREGRPDRGATPDGEARRGREGRPDGGAPPDGEATAEPERRPTSPAVTELSFAELLAGALAAYRDG